MEYPEDIYRDSFFPGLDLRHKKRFLVERAYRIGFAKGEAEQPDTLAGYSNLTAAISARKATDWERLDGLKTQCVHPELGTLRGKLERAPLHYPFTSAAWWKDESDRAYVEAFNQAWRGKDGWTLWIEGDIPMRRKTADELPLGTCFEGDYHGSRIELAQVIANRYGKRLVTDHAEKNIGGYAEGEVSVIKEYGIGTFHKPEGK